MTKLMYAGVLGVCATIVAPGASLGAVENPGMNAVADGQGVQTHGYVFSKNCQKPSPWLAQWIWLAGDAGEAGWFRKEITLAEAPQRVAAWLTADNKYQLFVNGRLVSRGPVDMGRDYAGGNTHRWFYDYRDLTPFFAKGTNVIAAKVFQHCDNVISRGKPGFLFEADLTLPAQSNLTVKSDPTWTAIQAQGTERCEDPGFDAAAWPPARVVTNVWEPLVPSEIPPLMEVRDPVARMEGLPGDKVFTHD